MAERKSASHILVWKIRNFSLCYLQKEQFLESPRFTTKKFKGCTWSLRFYPKGRTYSDSNYAACYLWCKHDRESLRIDFRLELCGSDGTILESTSREKESFNSGDFCGWPDFSKISEIEDKMKTWPEDTLIIRCHLFLTLDQFECVADTKFAVMRQTFLWNVKIQDELPEPKLISFSSGLHLEVSSSTHNGDINIAICLKKDNSTLSRNLVAKIALLDLKGNEVKSQCATYLFKTANDKFLYPVFLTKKQSLDDKDLYVEDDCFMLLGEFSISDGIEHSRIADSEADKMPNTTIALQSLQSDFLNMFLLKKHADVKLRVKSEIIQAHKCVLSARSPVFHAMFSQDMTESTTGIVDVLDVDVNTMTLFLEHVYTGTMKNMDYENSKKLLILADKYQVTSLKDECAEFLISCMSLSNVCDIFIISDLVIHEQLKKSAINYILTYSSNVFMSNEWNELAKNIPKLAADVISNLSANFKIVPLKKGDN